MWTGKKIKDGIFCDVLNFMVCESGKIETNNLAQKEFPLTKKRRDEEEIELESVRVI